jgi:hypothetical protein
MKKLFQNNTNVTYELDSLGNSVHRIEKKSETINSVWWQPNGSNLVFKE